MRALSHPGQRTIVPGPLASPPRAGCRRRCPPPGAELGPLGEPLGEPLGDAVDVPGDLLGGRLPELLPRPPLGLFDLTDQGEVPLLEGCAGRGPGGEDGEALLEVLARGEPRVVGLSAAARKSPGEEPFRHDPYLLDTLPLP